MERRFVGEVIHYCLGELGLARAIVGQVLLDALCKRSREKAVNCLINHGAESESVTGRTLERVCDGIEALDELAVELLANPDGEDEGVDEHGDYAANGD